MKNLARIDDEITKLRTELIDGKVVMMSPRLRINHAKVCFNIGLAFGQYLKGKRCEAFGDGVDVYLDEKNRFIPDVMIVCNPDIIKKDAIYGAPDLIVEVLSHSTEKNDRTKKKIAYERAGVKEYWIVDTWGKSVEVYLNHDKHFELDEIYRLVSEEEKYENEKLADDDSKKIIIHDEIKVSLYDDLFVSLADIFDRV